MREPDNRALPTYYGGFDIAVEEPGTVIVDEATGQEMTVEEGHVVVLRNRMWLTPTMMAKLKAHPKFGGQDERR